MQDERPDTHVESNNTPYANPALFPSGSVQGICSSASTIFALGMAFLGYWGFSDHQNHWLPVHMWVLLPALVSFISLGATPILATKPKKEEDLNPARHSLTVGISFLIGALIAAVVLDYWGEAQQRKVSAHKPQEISSVAGNVHEAKKR
jgi:hypothetical protein